MLILFGILKVLDHYGIVYFITVVASSNRRGGAVKLWEEGDLMNKNHQRMKVDPMFMIVQGLRSFVIAITTTAVAPIAVIFYLYLPEYT